MFRVTSLKNAPDVIGKGKRHFDDQPKREANITANARKAFQD